MGAYQREGFTLVELLVAVSIISLLMGILLPVISKVRQQARQTISAGRMKQIAGAIFLYGGDNGDRTPDSVATIGKPGGDNDWTWQDPLVVTGSRLTGPRAHRSMSGYLKSYVPDSKILYCPNTPKKSKYFEAAWEAGDEWDNPDTPMKSDALSGTYCFYWSYTGMITDRDRLFRGTRTLAGGGGQSPMLSCCYLGYNHYSNAMGFRSCERFPGAGIQEETILLPSFWINKASADDRPGMKLTCNFLDGHVERCDSADTVEMRVICDRQTGEVYDYPGPGAFYIPRSAVP